VIPHRLPVLGLGGLELAQVDDLGGMFISGSVAGAGEALKRAIAEEPGLLDLPAAVAGCP
jgi:hypothetical protein